MSKKLKASDERRIVSKVVTAFLKYLVSFNDGLSAAILSTKKWARWLIISHGEGKNYDVYRFNSKQKVRKIIRKEIDKNPTSFARELGEELDISYSIIYDGNLDNEPVYVYNNGKIGAGALSKQLASAIEVEIYYNVIQRENLKYLDHKNISKVLIDNKKSMSKEQLFDYFVSKQGMAVVTFEKYFGEIDIEKSERIKRIKYHHWDIYVDNGVKIDTGVIEDILDKVDRGLSKRGLGKLAGGKIQLVSVIKGQSKTLANYSPTGNIIKLRTKGIGRNITNAAHSVLHEVGHRNWVKFLGSNEKKMVEQKYFSAKNNIPSPKEFGLELGDILSHPSGSFSINKIQDKQVFAVLISTSQKKMKEKIGKLFVINSENLPRYKLNGKNMPDTDYESYFPTSYSETSKEEMYSDLFGEWLTKGLKEPAKSWFEELHS